VSDLKIKIPSETFGEPIQWVDTTRYVGVTLDKRLTWSPHIEQVNRRTGQRMGLLGPVLNRRDISVRNEALLYKQMIRPWWTTRAPYGDPQPAPMSGGYRCYNPSVFALLRVALGTSVTGRFTRIWVFHYSLTTSELWPRVSTQGYLTCGTP
jgi:hypothetical protein